MKIQGTLGGTTRPGANGILPPLDNGDLGANKGRRLIGAPPPPLDDTDVEELGIDVLLAKARAREKAALDAVPDPDYDPKDGLGERPPEPWPDAEIGRLFRLLCRKQTIEQIAHEMGRTHAAVKQKVYAMRQMLMPKSKAEAASMSRRNGRG